MSTDAIRDVTQAIHHLLQSGMGSNRRVTMLPPGEDPGDGSGVNLYMYRVAESPFLKNQPYPGDRAGQPPRPVPALSLELSYLLTPFGPAPDPAAGDDESQRALGEAMLVLHENPILERAHRPGFDADTLPAYLLDGFEQIKIRLHPVTLDELSKIWSTIGKPYRLSVAYEVTLVQLTPTAPQELSAGIVQETAVAVIPLQAPRLTGLAPARSALSILGGGDAPQPATLTISGFGFAFPGQSPAVLVGGQTARIIGSPSDRRLDVQLPERPAAGPDLDVIVRLLGRDSRPLTFAVDPWLSTVTPLRTALTAGTTLRLEGIGLAGAAEVRLTGEGGSWTSPAFLAGGDDRRLSLAAPAGGASNAAPAPGLGDGMYDLRVRLADQRLSNPRTLEVIPQLNDSGSSATLSGYDPATGTLTLRGARLDGTDVRLLVDDVEYALGRQTGGGELSRTLRRRLAPGTHRIGLRVDGHASRLITVVV